MVVGARQTKSATSTVRPTGAPVPARGRAVGRDRVDGSRPRPGERRRSGRRAGPRARPRSGSCAAPPPRPSRSSGRGTSGRGSAVIRTMTSFAITVVPPVTALRSPPDSRTTGADSPVMAASLTRAAPATTSPSPGMRSPSRTRTRSPGRGRRGGASSDGAVSDRRLEPAGRRRRFSTRGARRPGPSPAPRRGTRPRSQK